MNEQEFTHAELIAYLDEVAPTETISSVETALRGDDQLRQRLAEIVAARDAGLHSLGEVWRRRRLTCPTREQLGSHLLGVLEEGLADYVSFHLTVVECRWCNASVEDLRQQHDQSDEEAPRRRGRYFESSVGRVSTDE